MSKPKKSSRKAEAETLEDPLAGDLSEFIRGGIESGSWQVTKFELTGKKDKVLSLRLSDKLLTELKKQAKALNLDTQKFIRIVLEASVRRKAS